MDTATPKGARDEKDAAGLKRRHLNKDQLTDLQEKALSQDEETENGTNTRDEQEMKWR